ncbi:MAG: hypothetical protein V3W22_05170 [Thermoplasmata archaeon]
MALKEKDLLGDYHLLLAHDVAAQQTLYHDIFHDVDAYIIMDNSTVELGKPVETPVMRAACDAVKASVIVLPDTIWSAETTLKDCIRHAYEWDKAGLGPFLAVPQGRNWNELTACTRALQVIPGIDAWGVGRFIRTALGTRVHFTWWLSTIPFYMRPVIHLLGFSDDIPDDILSSKLPGVAGIDSAVPIRMGLKGVTLTGDVKTPSRGDYWETAHEVTNLVEYNLMVARAWFEIGGTEK